MSEVACEACGVVPSVGVRGRSGIHRHHWSYEPEHVTDTIPLCASCHRRVHAGRIPEPRTGRVYDRAVKVSPHSNPSTFRFPPDLAAELDRRAAAEECPTSVIVFRSLRAALGVPVPTPAPEKARND